MGNEKVRKWEDETEQILYSTVQNQKILKFLKNKDKD